MYRVEDWEVGVWKWGLVVRVWEMIYKNWVFEIWVKNVNKLRQVGGINGELVSTVCNIYIQLNLYINGKVQLIQQFIPKQHTDLSTNKVSLFYLLNIGYTYFTHRLLLRQLKNI